jgi:peroxiredoxin
MIGMRKVLAIVLVSGICLLLGIQFMRSVRPAVAREAVAACNGLRSLPRSETIKRIPTATPAPDFSLKDHTGKVVTLSDYRGKVVIVNFWASWCSTCKAEKPSLEELQRELGYDDAVVLALASDIGWEPIAKKMPKGSPLKVLLDPPAEEGQKGAIALAWGVEAFPETFIIAPDGTIRYYIKNKRTWDAGIAATCVRGLANQ